MTRDEELTKRIEKLEAQNKETLQILNVVLDYLLGTIDKDQLTAELGKLR